MANKILFVCHGNICRSPMAEFVFKKMLTDNHINDVYVASAATSTEEIYCGHGSPIYPPAKAQLEKHGVSFEDREATLLLRSDYDRYDMFIGMDGNNVRNMLRIFGSDPQQKISKMMDYTTRGGDVADPWYTRDFDRTYQDIYEGCFGLLAEIK